MLRYIQQGIHKALRHNQARAPCQKASQDSEEFENPLKLAQFRHYGSRSLYVSQPPLNVPLPQTWYSCGTAVGGEKFSPSQDNGGKDSGNWHYSADVLRGAIVGAGLAVLNGVHGYCTGKKDAGASRVAANRSRFCPVTQYQRQYQKLENLSRSNALLGSLAHLLADTSPVFSVLPKQAAIKHQTTLEERVSGELTSKDEIESPKSKRHQQYQVAKQKIKSLMDELTRVDEGFLAADHMRALRAWSDGDYGLAVNLWHRTVHEMATPIAANKLGDSYQHGLGVERDLDKAAEYYRLAASCGNSLAMYNLAALLVAGHVTSLDEDGMLMMEKSASLGCVKAQTYLGVFYYNSGQKRRAVKYLEKAARADDGEACFYLAVCYETGSGVATSDEKALELYTRAAQAGHPDAQYNLAVFLEEGYGGIEIDQTQAVYWYKKALDQGHQLAKDRLKEIGQFSLRSSLSLPLMSHYLSSTMSDLSLPPALLPRSSSEGFITGMEFSLTADALPSSHMTPASSCSSIAAGKPKFFLQSAVDEMPESSFSGWSDDEDSTSSIGSISAGSREFTVESVSFNTPSLLSRGTRATCLPHDDLLRPEHEGPLVLFV